MKLVEIWQARQAWKTLAALKKNPRLAYQLLKYERKVAVEIEICEKERVRTLYGAAGVEPGGDVQLQPDTPEMAVFLEVFGKFLGGESDLESSSITMDDLIEALGEEKGNVLSENDIELLEPFFTV